MVDLSEIFAEQKKLNERCGCPVDVIREHLRVRANTCQVPSEEITIQGIGEWINNYLDAMASEVQELKDCLYWKHWCQEAKEGRRMELHDLQNARVEVIDMFFFVVSLALCVGLNADEVSRLYMQKLKVNHERQDKGYSMSTKDEVDNKAINLDDSEKSKGYTVQPMRPKEEG